MTRAIPRSRFGGANASRCNASRSPFPRDWCHRRARLLRRLGPAGIGRDGERGRPDLYARAGRRDQARHLPAVRQRPLPEGQPERAVGCRADAAPAELPEGQRDVRHERSHGPHLAHRRRDPGLAHRSLSGPPGPGSLELVRLLPAGRVGRLLVVVQVLDRQHRRGQSGEQPADGLGGPELQHGQSGPAVARRHRRRPERARTVGAVYARRLRRRGRRPREHRTGEQHLDRPAQPGDVARCSVRDR